MLKLMVDQVKARGFSAIYLETGAFMTAVQGLYCSMGFHEREEHPENEVPIELRRFWLFMEKLLLLFLKFFTKVYATKLVFV